MTSFTTWIQVKMLTALVWSALSMQILLLRFKKIKRAALYHCLSCTGEINRTAEEMLSKQRL